MGIWESITDLAEAVKPWATVEAEAPAEDKETSQEESKDEPKEEEEEASEEAESEDAEEGEEAEEEEEEEDEEEIVDPKEKLEEECKESKGCAPAKHHYDECVERVTGASESEDGAKEDCVEEFFHLAHCATQCAAPKLWSALK